MPNRRGVSRAVVLLAIIAVALLIAIAIPIVLNRTNNMARDVDDLYAQSAEDEARLKWMDEYTPFSGFYDTENKRFIEPGTNMIKITPYGTSKENEGKVIYVKVDDKGNITTKWTRQDDVTVLGTAQK